MAVALGVDVAAVEAEEDVRIVVAKDGRGPQKTVAALAAEGTVVGVVAADMDKGQR